MNILIQTNWLFNFWIQTSFIDIFQFRIIPFDLRNALPINNLSDSRLIVLLVIISETQIPKDETSVFTDASSIASE